MVAAMSLSAGQSLAHYEILELIGQGGMGEVYRARDTKLGRDVAIKVLPAEFMDSEERLARFKREAMVLASLNHPNIGGIHGLEESDSVRFLALELVPGQTLAERLRESPLPVSEALELASQMAGALAAAHDSGVIHRDLKPANIKITPSGQIKVLDFGLAKALVDAPADDAVSDSPTLSAHATKMGVILGTAAYMSPEQARGKPVDKRTDIFSFGAVLYEMLTGRQLFKGEDAADTMASVIRSDPDFRALPAELPPRVREVLTRCLEKDPEKRRRDIGDVKAELDILSSSPHEEPMTGSKNASRAGLFLAVVASAAVASLVTWVALRSDAPGSTQPLRRFDVLLDEGSHFARANRHMLALSPAGTHLVVNADNRLLIRRMDEKRFVPIPGTENAQEPFFSPDGDWVGFWADGHLKKAPVGGGAPSSLCDAESPLGASWSADGTILFSQSRGIFEVPENGGAPRLLIEEQEDFARSPQKLADNVVLFTLANGLTRDRSLVMERLDTGERTTLVPEARDGRYLVTGHLIYGEERRLSAIPFDLDRLEVSGPAIPVVQNVASLFEGSAVQFDVSREGTLAFLNDDGYPESKLMWMDRRGTATPLSDRTGRFARPRLSPDGKRVALWMRDNTGDDVWVLDTTLDTLTRLTSGGTSQSPEWSPDGQWILYSSGAEGADLDLYRMRSDFVGKPELVMAREGDEFGWYAPDGSGIIFQSGNLRDFDIWWLPNDADEPELVVDTPGNASYPSLSPDGQWLVYHSNASGGPLEVYIQPFPAPVRGGRFPREEACSPSGHETATKSISTKATIRQSKP